MGLRAHLIQSDTTDGRDMGDSLPGGESMAASSNSNQFPTNELHTSPQSSCVSISRQSFNHAGGSLGEAEVERVVRDEGESSRREHFVGAMSLLLLRDLFLPDWEGVGESPEALDGTRVLVIESVARFDEPDGRIGVGMALDPAAVDISGTTPTSEAIAEGAGAQGLGISCKG